MALTICTAGPETRPGRARRGVTSPCQTVARLVAREFRVPTAAMLAGGRGGHGAARARQAAMYLSHVVFGIPTREIGDFFGRDRTTVAHACGRIEDLRDDARFDACLEQLGARAAARRAGREA